MQETWFSDLVALLCGGGMVVATPYGSTEDTSVAAQSTVQFDGDVTMVLDRAAVGNKDTLSAHLVKVEMRVQAVARSVKWIRCTGHFVIGSVAIGIAYNFSDILYWFISLLMWPSLEGILRLPRVRGFLLASAMWILSRFFAKNGLFAAPT